jgi:hypothetical protein
MYIRFKDAKTMACRIRDVQLITKSGTISDGKKYINWSKKVSSNQIKESTGVLDLVPGTNDFQDIYSFIFRRVSRVLKNGSVQTEVRRLSRDGHSTLTILDDGVRSFKYVYNVDGSLKQTVLYDKKGMKIKTIEV